MGKAGNLDGGDAKPGDVLAVTCEQGGRTYQAGEVITLSGCASCVCQADGTVGLCTGACPRDAAVETNIPVTCTEDGVTYQVGDPVVLSACTTCVCQSDGKLGRCTGLCPPDAAVATDATVTCTQDGITYQVGDPVVLSPCTTCVCQKDGKLGLCTGLCLPDAAVGIDATVTCTEGAKTYQVGEVIRRNGCTSCVCQNDGSIGMCTGDCPPDASSDGQSSLAALCTSTQGQIASSLCCLAVTDFPNSCLTGACGCSPSSSHTVTTCSCPAGTCFDPAAGCVGLPEVCTPGMDQTCNANPAISSIHGRCQADGSCVCNAGFTRATNGKCN